MKLNTSNLAGRLESLAARAKEATRLFNHLARAKRQADGFDAQAKAINTDGLPDNSPVVKLRKRTEDKHAEALKEVATLEQSLAEELDGPIGKYAREALLALEGDSGAGAADIYSYPEALILHDKVFDSDRLPVEVRAKNTDGPQPVHAP